MIFLPRNPFNPPHGRIDDVIYSGAAALSNVISPVGWQVSDSTLRYWDNSLWDDLGAVFAPGGVLNAYDASNLYNVAASGLAAGGAFPAIDGGALTNLQAGNLAALGTFPSIDGSNLYNLPAPARLISGGASLDAAGHAVLVTDPACTAVVACWGFPGFTGILLVQNLGGGNWSVDSNLGAVDGSLFFYYIAF